MRSRRLHFDLCGKMHCAGMEEFLSAEDRYTFSEQRPEAEMSVTIRC